MRIKVLSDHVINQISAGEVVDRPASVVRELVDNAVDAGAAEVTVYLEDGGRALCRVCDDGCGMDKDEALMAFERHATSKLNAVKDLQSIETMGFRGEALPSIAAVSSVTLRTRAKSAKVGNEVLVEAGEIKKVSTCAIPAGTDVSVAKLFYNTPVRKKFLREARSEELRVKEWLIQSSLARPNVRYRLFSDNREVLNLPKRESSLQRAHSIYRGNTSAIEFERNGVRVIGLVGHPAGAQADAKSFVTIVNNRLVTDRALLRAVKDGFDSMLKEREFPVGFVKVDLAPHLVDVNVHPQKSEVRFRNPQDVFLAVRIGVLESIRSFKRPLNLGPNKPFAEMRPASAASQQHLSAANDAFAVSRSSAVPIVQGPLAIDTHAELLASLEVREDPSFKFSELEYLGQILACYLVCRTRNELVLVDMHAAHERCNFNTVRNDYKRHEVASQALLLPLSIEIGEERVQALAEQEQVLKQFGFDLAFKGDIVTVNAAVGMVRHDAIEPLIKELASTALEGPLNSRLESFVDAVCARIACHASIRGGDALSAAQVSALFASLDSTEMSSACPHGRPVALSFNRDNIERWFGRRG